MSPDTNPAAVPPTTPAPAPTQAAAPESVANAPASTSASTNTPAAAPAISQPATPAAPEATPPAVAASPAPPPATQAPPTATPPATTPGVQPAAPAPPAPPAAAPQQKWKKWLLIGAVIVVLVIAGVFIWKMLHPAGFGDGFVSGNGRLEATETDVSTKLAGRILDILVKEGDVVTAAQPLAHMQVQTLAAQREEATARLQQATTAIASAEAQVEARRSDQLALRAVVAQRESEFDAAQRRLARSETLSTEGASSVQELDDDRARMRTALASIAAAKAQAQAAQAAITAARTQVLGARAEATAVAATITRINADITDSTLVSPRNGRVQYRIAEHGEVLAAGGKLLNLIDLEEVYMTFFVPEATAGRLALGEEVHLVLDATPQYVIPAKVTFVASTAQFTPKTVETANERQKLMFRVKAQIDSALLQKHLPQIKSGLPGVAWLKLDANAAWPNELMVKVPWSM